MSQTYHEHLNSGHGRPPLDARVDATVADQGIRFPTDVGRILPRLDGVEFGALRPCEDVAEFGSGIESIIAEPAETNVFHNHHNISPSSGGGIAFGASSNAWSRADDALYKPKADGENRVAIDDTILDRESLRLAS